MKPERTNPLKWAIYGAFLFGVAAFVRNLFIR